MIHTSLQELVLAASLADPARRREAARALARALGAEDMVIFIPDPETAALVPAPGFGQTLPQRRVWLTFLNECVVAGSREGKLPSPSGGTAVRATGLAVGDGSVLVLLGRVSGYADLGGIQAVLPLLTWALRAEYMAYIAQGQANAARQAAADARALAEALDRAMREVEAAKAAAEEAATALRASEERYRLLFEGVGDAILVLDTEGHYLDGNAAVEKLLGYARDRLRRMHIEMIMAGPTGFTAWSQIVDECHAQEGQWSGELELRRRDGSLAPVEARATLIHLPAGPAYLLAMRDISERRALARMQSEFMSMITHEWRTPLATVKGHAQLMQRSGAYSAAAVQVMVTQVNRLERLVGDLLDISRLEAGRLELQRQPVNLVTLVYAVVAQAQELTRVHHLRVFAPEHPLIGEWDATRVEQVLHNLLSNAIKYSPDGGEIVVRVEERGHEVQVSVSDQGMGISPEELSHLFQRFYRTAQARAIGMPGIGLGLHISKALIEAHGGRLWAESYPGKGSTFFFTLPRKVQK
jgi:PAS domain S-box-containing protein